MMPTEVRRLRDEYFSNAVDQDDDGEITGSSSALGSTLLNMSNLLGNSLSKTNVDSGGAQGRRQTTIANSRMGGNQNNVNPYLLPGGESKQGGFR